MPFGRLVYYGMMKRMSDLTIATMFHSVDSHVEVASEEPLLVNGSKTTAAWASSFGFIQMSSSSELRGRKCDDCELEGHTE